MIRLISLIAWLSGPKATRKSFTISSYVGGAHRQLMTGPVVGLPGEPFPVSPLGALASLSRLADFLGTDFPLLAACLVNRLRKSDCLLALLFRHGLG